MSASDGVQILISAQDDFSPAFESAQESLNQFSNSISDFTSTESSLASSSNMAIQSTEELSQAENEAAVTTGRLQTDTQSASQSFGQGMQSVMGVTGAMSMGIGSAIGLGDAYMQQENATLKLKNAQDNLSKQQQIVEQDQEKLAYAQQKLTDLQNSGHASATQLAAAQQAVTTATDTLQNAQISLANAQNNVTTSQNRLTMSNEQVEMQMLQFATMTIPTLLSKGPELIAFLTGYGAEEDALTVSQLAQSAASGIASGAMALFDAVMDANPIVLVVLAIGGLVAALAYLTDGFKNFGPLEQDFNDAWKGLQIIFDDLVNFVKSDLYPVFEDLYNTYIKPIITGINDISSIGGAASSGLSSIGKDISSIHLAEGGIVDRPTFALIGEAGPEAVLPLASTTFTTPSNFQPLPQINQTTTTATNTTKNATINIYQNNQLSSNLDVNSMTSAMSNIIAQQLLQGY
ncbi:MAG: hypothetical protein JRN20_09710 [Nitrososphaerota archaeon]|nr:hypothetical protein [Nitrososphaerota archaeon]MDG6922974.1 hypothetical protein [Nitrososphaerota archaeon]